MKVQLFVTCLIDSLFPEVGEAVVDVLARAGVEIEFPGDQTCCGQPAFNAGFWDQARRMEELLRQGVGILMLTSDYTEALEMSHRIIVMRRGVIAKEYQRGEPTEADILREAIGKVTENGASAAA